MALQYYPPAGRCYGVRRNIGLIKDAVDLADYASQHTDLHKSGRTLRGKCPVHKGNNPSVFAVYLDDQRWHCFSCDEGGDVLDLYCRLENCEAWVAMLELGRDYNIDLKMGRTPEWHRWNQIKEDARNRVQAAIIERLQRRLFKVLCVPYLHRMPTAEDHLDGAAPRRRRAALVCLW